MADGEAGVHLLSDLEWICRCRWEAMQENFNRQCKGMPGHEMICVLASILAHENFFVRFGTHMVIVAIIFDPRDQAPEVTNIVLQVREQAITYTRQCAIKCISLSSYMLWHALVDL